MSVSESDTRSLLRAMVALYGNEAETPSISELERMAGIIVAQRGYSVDLADVVRQVLLQITPTMGKGVSLVDRDEGGHDPNWLDKRQIEWRYSRAYIDYLKRMGWPPRVADTLDLSTKKIAGLLQDPLLEGSWDRRGLVIGHVQSGKTANYLGVVARAADAGYRFIVIVAGIHNNLRRQTQERVDEGFVGEISDPARIAQMRAQGRSTRIGVGLFDPDHRRPVALTSTADDFKKAVASTLRGGLDDWSKPVVVVIKKNCSTLRALYRWLEDFNRNPGQTQIASVPMLFIDDEADNASINTNKPELDPTKTNELIRKLLRLFRRSSYVGYTATPFANIFINHDLAESPAGQDLFPRHFIHCLDAPSNYFGPQRVFLDDPAEDPEPSTHPLREISDCEGILPLTHSKDHELDELPASLKEAIRAFVIARAIRTARGQETLHCSMLVNVSRFVRIQKEVHRLVVRYLDTLRHAVFANAALPDELAMANEHVVSLRTTFDTQGFNKAGVEWNEIKELLTDASRSIDTAVVNSDTQDSLNYAGFADRGEARNVIAIGGLSLSRGLTLEGLTISYMYRNTKTYDTLLQMGRWFGYRPDYEDLCRVWLAPESIGWYRHISESSEELRDRIKEMNRTGGATPRTFGLMVRAHPDSLTVTAMNKMRHAEERSIQVSYDGRLVETYAVHASDAINSENRRLIGELFSNLSSEWPDRFCREGERPSCRVWRSVPARIVNDFVASFRVHPHIQQSILIAREYMSLIRDDFPEWDIAFVSIANSTNSTQLAGIETFSMRHQRRSAGTSGQSINWLDDGLFVTNNQRVAGTRDEAAGLSDAEIERMQQRAHGDGRAEWTDRDARFVRGRPLLMLHILDIDDPFDKSQDRSRRPILVKGAPAIGLSFPATGKFRNVEYVLNRVMIEQMSRTSVDDADDEEDFDVEDR